MQTHAAKTSEKTNNAPRRRQQGTFADNRPEARAQQQLQEAAANSPKAAQLRRLQQAPVQATASGAPVVQRKLNWYEGPRVHTKNMPATLLNYEDFGITPAILNTAEMPRDNNMAGVMNEPALLFNPTEEGVAVSVHAESVNRVGYRMELPAPPPWQAMSTIGAANGRLIGLNSGLHEDVKPDDGDAVQVNIYGLPNNGAFAALVEEHENFHVKELKRIVREVLMPWDFAIKKFKLEDRKMIGVNETDATAKFYAAVGGTPLEVAERFRDALSVSGKAFHRTKEGSSPTIGMKRFKRADNPPHFLHVEWQHPLG